jgi:predicted phosphohydrolase
MPIFAIADLHLSTLDSTNKSMEVFGKRWTGYINKLKDNWKKLVSDSDTVVIPGDISWALTLSEAESDLKFLDSLPGKKLLGKGNHDFWWCTMKKHEEFFKERGINSISFLYNNAYETDEFIIAGVRGWYHDEEIAPNNTDFEKLVNRETQRLKFSLEAAEKIRDKSPEKEILVFMHFPPFWNGKESERIVELLCEHGIKRIYYGHIHSNYTVPPEFEHKGIKMSIISADYLNFTPKIIRAEENNPKIT